MPRLVPPPSPYESAALEAAARQQAIRRARTECQDKAVRGALAAPMPLSPGSYGYRAPKPTLVQQVTAELSRRNLTYELEREEGGFYIDVAVPSLALALECGVQFHREPKKRRVDEMKKFLLRNAGWNVRRITARDEVWPQVDAAIGWVRGLRAEEIERQERIERERRRLAEEFRLWKERYGDRYAPRPVSAAQKARLASVGERLEQVRRAMRRSQSSVPADAGELYVSPERRDASQSAREVRDTLRVFPNCMQDGVVASFRRRS